MENLTSVQYYCDKSTGGRAKLCRELLGRFISDLVSGPDEVLATSPDGLFSLRKPEPISPNQFVRAARGKSFFVGVTTEGMAYSWGEGSFGELGQGVTRQHSIVPGPVKGNFTCTNVACGDNHVVAYDSKGNAFGWGQNYERQLGLYTKAAADMKSRNCIVEEVVFVPKFLPFTLTHPVTKVACGSQFTVFVTREGAVYTCGAGECGQLGVGRCKFREVPQQVPLELAKGEQIVDAACGEGHVIALTSSGDLMAWGFNRRGQLGCDHCSTAHDPVRVPPIVSTPGGEKATFSKVYASRQSSAAITKSGSLFTWGSGEHFELMQGGNQNLSRPTHVASLEGNKVHSFAFSTAMSAAMILSKLTSLFPTSGPQKSFNRLDIRGCGFWECSTIIVKFTCVGGTGFSAPRSCVGYVSSPGVISCRPPRLSEAGEYEVTVSMNGTTFLPDVLKLDIYKDFTVSGLSPSLLDRRTSAANKFSVTAKGLVIPDDKELIIRVTLSPNLESSPQDKIFIVEGSILPNEPLKEPEPLNVLDRMDSTKTIVKKPDVIPNKVIEFAFDVNAALKSETFGVAYMKVQLSLNGQDFTAIASDADIGLIHSFEAESVSPNCFAIVSDESGGKRTVTINGNSFFNTRVLPPHIKLEVVLSASFNRNAQAMVVLPINCDSNVKFEITPPTILQFNSSLPTPVASESDLPTSLKVTIRCRLATTEVEHGKGHHEASKTHYDWLADKGLNLLLYTPQAIAVTPVLYRRGSNLPLVVTGKSKGGFSFYSSDAAVQFLREDRNYQCTATTLRMVPSGTSLDGIFDQDAKAVAKGAGEFKIAVMPEPSVLEADFVNIAVLLDGKTKPPKKFLATLTFFDGVVVKAGPKGVVSPGASVTVDLSGAVSLPGAAANEGISCCVRISLSAEAQSPVLDLVGTIVGDDPAEQKLTFTLPEAAEIAALTGDAGASVKGKPTAKSYFVGVSIDGKTSFDFSEKPILQIK